ncbi:MAG: DUF4270 family protein [Bacteroidetes bacterium]|nr:DUF4270 family protein [Bacteroidota bacterium]
MKKRNIVLKNIVLTIFIFGGFIACDKDFASLDSDVINPDNAINFSTDVEEYPIITYNHEIGPVRTNGLPSYLLGYSFDPVFGTSTSNFVSQISPSVFDPTFGDNIVLDSVILTVPYFSRLIETDSIGNGTYEIDSIFEDIDRIEIIRGPGGTIWGANAVNGVINIITKDSKDTQGFFVTSGGGNEEQGFVETRYGAKISDNFTYRIFGKFFNRDEFEDPSGEKSNDSWHSFRTGFRSDLTISKKDTMSLSAEFFNIDKDQTVEIPILTDPPDFAEKIKDKAKYKGFNFLHKWWHIFPNSSESRIQTYYDYTERTFDFFGKEKRHTLDIDFTHNLNFHFALPQEIIWGLGFRLTSDNFSNNTSILSINDLNRTDKIFSAFIQDKISYRTPTRIKV